MFKHAIYLTCHFVGAGHIHISHVKLTIFEASPFIFFLQSYLRHVPDDSPVEAILAISKVNQIFDSNVYLISFHVLVLPCINHLM